MIAFRRFLPRLLGATLLGAGSLTITAGTAQAGPPAVVGYTMNANWGSGFQVLVTSTPATAVTGWSVEFDAAEGQQLVRSFYANATQTGRHVVLTNLPFNGSVPAGGTVSTGVQFTNPELITAPPPGFLFNGQAATSTPQPYLRASAVKPVVPEGGSAAVAVTLSQPPASTLTVQVGQGSASAVLAAPQRLTFTAADWNVPQTLTLTSPADADTADQTAWLALNPAGGPPFYAPQYLLATQRDNGATP